ncbi:MAG: desulfoferrodoxin family protein [Promethearchaeota archaeon]
MIHELIHKPGEDFIKWLKLYGVDKDGNFRELGSYCPKPVEEQPVAEFEVDVSNQKELHALIFCNLHGLWESKLAL